MCPLRSRRVPRTLLVQPQAAHLGTQLGPIEVAVFNVGTFSPGSVLTLSGGDYHPC